MEKIFETDSIILEYNPHKSDSGYRLTFLDKYGHYLDEIYIDKRHVCDLRKGFVETEFDSDFDNDY